MHGSTRASAGDGARAHNSPPRRWGLTSLVVACGILAAIVWANHHGGERDGPLTSLAEVVHPGDAAGFNVLLVTLDTVRRDRLGCYGYGPAETPAIDSLARSGVLVEDAMTSAPLTLPSHATMLTGLYPPRHGVRNNGTFQLADEQVTLAETLKAQGYETAAFIASFTLDARFGLAQGFDTYDFPVLPEGVDLTNAQFSRRPAPEVTDSAIRWLQDRRRLAHTAPFFMWVHYFDAHVPLTSPYSHLPRFADRPYDAGIAYLDSYFKKLLEELDQQGLREKTLILLVSDHGEGLGEHSEPNHGMLLYDTTIRVPFIISCPALFKKAYRLDDRIVGLTDLRPTVEHLLGLPLHLPADGVSLLDEHHDADRAIYMEAMAPYYEASCSPLYGLRRHHDAYVSGREPEYFDWSADPAELVNRYESTSGQVSTMAALLDNLTRNWPPPPQPGAGTRSVSREEIARLGALGYVQAPSTSKPDRLPDPKTMVRANLKINQALHLLRQQRLDEALATAQEAIAQCPTFADANLACARVYQAMNRPEEAIRVLRESVKRTPTPDTALELARLLMIAGRDDEMELALRTAETLDPRCGMVYIIRGDHYAKQGRFKEALAEYEQALRIDEYRTGPLIRPQLERLRQAMQESPNFAPH